MNIRTILPIASAIVLYSARMIELNTKRDIIPGQIPEKWTLRLFQTAGAVMYGGGVAEYVLRHSSFTLIPFLIGWVLILLGFVLRNWAIRSLGKFWSLHVEIRDSHQFVRSGPFRWVRHPTYLSMIMELIAGAFLLNSHIVAPFALIIFIPTLIYRIKIEEAALIQKFGPAYEAYIRNTPALFPY